MADKVTYSSYIDACGKSGQFEEAKKTFYEALKLEIADAVTYSSYIDACGKSGQFEEARKIFYEARELKIANAFTYSSYIDACGKNGQFEEAKKAFDDAVERGIATRILYHVYIDLLVKRNAYDDAHRVFDAGKLPLVKKIEDGKKAVDLHGFSHGSGFIAILHILKLLPQGEPELVVITGIGCKEDGNYLSFRNDLKDKIEKELNMKCVTDPRNKGIFLLQIGKIHSPEGP